MHVLTWFFMFVELVESLKVNRVESMKVNLTGPNSALFRCMSLFLNNTNTVIKAVRHSAAVMENPMTGNNNNNIKEVKYIKEKA